MDRKCCHTLCCALLLLVVFHQRFITYVILESSLSFSTGVKFDILYIFIVRQFMQALPPVLHRVRQVVPPWGGLLWQRIRRHIDVEWYIVIACEKFLGSSPQALSHIVYLCRSFDLIRQLEEDEEWLDELLLEGSIEWELAESRRVQEEQHAYSLINQLDGLLQHRHHGN